MAVYQLQMCYLIPRYRGQARSHIGFYVSL